MSTKTKTKSSSVLSMEKELSSIEKKSEQFNKQAEALRNKIKAEKEKNKPKSILELINSFEDACKYKKVKPSSIYDAKRDTPDEVAYKKIKFTHKVLNNGHKFKMDNSEERWYAWWYLNSSGSGFVFNVSFCNYSYAGASSSARLCLIDEPTAKHSAKILYNEWKAFIM